MRYCSIPDIFESHLRNNVGFEGHINELDKVCYPCYRSIDIRCSHLFYKALKLLAQTVTSNKSLSFFKNLLICVNYQY